jgi:hypothetical protein
MDTRNIKNHPIESVHHPRQNHRGRLYQKPRLERFVQGWNITGDVSWLLDFAIIGFPKAGTSTLMLYLENQTESVHMFHHERCEMGWNQHVPLLVDLHKYYQGPHVKMGIKCPRDLEVDLALSNYHTYFPRTKFIVGIRHPIQWFQSFYNFRITNEFPMPSETNRLIGRCKKAHQGVCTVRANFSQHLAKIEPWRKVFLYDVAQLQDGNAVRAQQFRRDLQAFLELQTPLTDSMLWIKPGQEPASPQRAHELNALKINICETQHDEVRRVLWQQAIVSSRWIHDEFLTNPNVQVSSPVYFTELLNRWLGDPCNSTSAR